MLPRDGVLTRQSAHTVWHVRVIRKADLATELHVTAHVHVEAVGSRVCEAAEWAEGVSALAALERGLRVDVVAREAVASNDRQLIIVRPSVGLGALIRVDIEC